jgi:hypothetical protein
MDYQMPTYVDRYVHVLPRATLVYDYKITAPGSVELVYSDTVTPDDYADWHLTCCLDQNGSPTWEVDVDCGEGRQQVEQFQFEAIIVAVDKLTPRLRTMTQNRLLKAAHGDDR